MAGLLWLSRAIDRFTMHIGRAAALAVLAVVFVSAGNALARKTFGFSSNIGLELQPLLFGAVFLLGAPWAVRTNAHIRIDVMSGMLSQRTRDWIDVIGHALFLIPIALVVMWTGWPFFWRSWLQNEQSINPGGLPQYPGKLLVPLCFTLLLAQGISELIKRLAHMRSVPQA